MNCVEDSWICRCSIIEKPQPLFFRYSTGTETIVGPAAVSFRAEFYMSTMRGIKSQPVAIEPVRGSDVRTLQINYLTTGPDKIFYTVPPGNDVHSDRLTDFPIPRRRDAGPLHVEKERLESAEPPICLHSYPIDLQVCDSAGSSGTGEAFLA